jgi:hypothetical protein
MWLGAQCHGFQAFLNPCSPGGQKGCFRRSRKWMKRLLQLRVLDLGFFQDGDVGVGVFPEDEPTQQPQMPSPQVALPEPAR